jgi:adenylylsulfate kinase
MPEVNVTWHDHQVAREPGCVVWFTGLSGSGKSTVANVVDHKLHELAAASFLLDGDNVRHGLNASADMLLEQHGEAFAKRFGLGFAAEDRAENIRRIGAVSELFCSAGLVTLVAFVSPYRSDRDAVRAMLPAGRFVEVFVDTPLEVCEQRDPKGLYKKARAGEIKAFTGIDDPYEAPLAAEIVLAGGERSPELLAVDVIAFLCAKSFVKK